MVSGQPTGYRAASAVSVGEDRCPGACDQTKEGPAGAVTAVPRPGTPRGTRTSEKFLRSSSIATSSSAWLRAQALARTLWIRAVQRLDRLSGRRNDPDGRSSQQNRLEQYHAFCRCTCRRWSVAWWKTYLPPIHRLSVLYLWRSVHGGVSLQRDYSTKRAKIQAPGKSLDFRSATAPMCAS